MQLKNKIKGIVLAGGTGSRLFPLTKVTNKSLLPVYDEPMIFYPIRLLLSCGIDEILVICGGNQAGDFLPILGNGEYFQNEKLKLSYAYQDGPHGIAHALGLARSFANNDPVCVILGDNIFEVNSDNIVKGIPGYVQSYSCNPKGAAIFSVPVDNPQNYGVLEVKDERTVIVEKPVNPSSNNIVTGLYLFDKQVWGYIDSLKPSARGELEITDVNNFYLEKDAMRTYFLSTEWADCGENKDMYLKACNQAARWKNSKK